MENCPCGEAKTFDSCCAPIISGDVTPESAEKVMRARYSAFSTGAVDFIESSLHPNNRGDFDYEGTKDWALNSKWKGLQIVDTEGGEAADDQGFVEFIARYERDGKECSHHERSEFIKEDGKWYFTEGTLKNQQVKRVAPKTGRNDPCPCGSGKKYKKCCLS